MRRIVSLYLLLVLVGVLCHCFAVVSWTNSKAVGPSAFPGSPDWSYMYGSSLERYLWVSGMLVGLVLGGVALFASASVSESLGQGNWWRAVAIASVVIPVIALAGGYFFEKSVVQGDAVVGGGCSSESTAEPPGSVHFSSQCAAKRIGIPQFPVLPGRGAQALSGGASAPSRTRFAPLV